MGQSNGKKECGCQEREVTTVNFLPFAGEREGQRQGQQFVIYKDVVERDF